jgi:hypothetical protein
MIGNGRDMAVGPARGNHHLVGDGALAVQIDGGDLLGLGVVEAGQDR